MSQSNGSPDPPGSSFARFRKSFCTWILLIFRLHVKGIWSEFVKRPKKIVDFPNKTGEVAVITGGARGIGLEVIRRLLLCNFDVIMGVRSIKSGQEAIEKLRAEGVSTGTVKFLQLDLKSLNSVKKFAREVLQQATRIDLLINNAGIMFAPYEVTEDGYESAFQVNYLSHFLLTQLLLPRIKETGELRKSCCRIVSVSSDFHVAGRIDFEDLEKCKVFSSAKSYADSKLCQIVQTKYMNRKLEVEEAKVKMYSLHPGMIPSDLWINIPPCFNKFISLLSFMCKNVDHGADNVVYAAISEDLKNSGGAYINNSKVDKPLCIANCKTLQTDLYQKSLKLVESQL